MLLPRGYEEYGVVGHGIVYKVDIVHAMAAPEPYYLVKSMGVRSHGPRVAREEVRHKLELQLKA